MNDEIEIFLTSPVAFVGDWSQNNSTIERLQAANEGVRINGKIESPTGVLIGWGKEPSRRENYYYGSSSNMTTRRKIEKFKVTGNEAQLKITKVENYRTPRWSQQYYNSDVVMFTEIIQRDQRTMAFLENIPGLEEKFNQFVNDTMHWWVHNEETVALWNEARNHAPNSFMNAGQNPKANELCDITDLVTKENAGKLEDRLNALLEIGAEEGVSAYKVETFAKLGIKNGGKSTFLYEQRNRQNTTETIGPYDDVSNIPVTEDLGVLSSWKSGDQNKVESLKTAYYETHRAVHSDFTVNFRTNPENDYKIYARFSWKRIRYVHEKTITKQRRNDWQGNRRTVYDRNTVYRTMFLPVVDCLCLEVLPPEEVGVNPHYEPNRGMNFSQGSGLRVSPTSGFVITRLERVRDATKKRASKGGYKGGYQGIDEIKVGTAPIFSFVLKSTFSDIAGAPPIRGYSLDVERTVPLTREQYMAIERPNVDVKPIEVGHLNLMRLSDPPKRLVVGDTLSDLLLPSMPALIIAVDTDMKVTNGEHYQTGALCSGDCAESETVDINLPPGLYLVERKLKCALGHDPGRSEYTAGFGDICNEVITIRNMLSQLDIAYDEFRGNMVGTSKSNKFAETKLDSGAFLGRLG